MGRPKKSPEQVERRQYTLEYKRAAVQQLAESGQSVAQVARALGVRAQQLYQWRRQVTGETLPPPTRRAATPSADDEVRRLKRRVAELEEEAVILGKAMAFFAKRHG